MGMVSLSPSRRCEAEATAKRPKDANMEVGIAAADETHYSNIGRAYSVFGSKALHATHGVCSPSHGACPVPLFHAHSFANKRVAVRRPRSPTIYTRQ